MKLNLAKTKFMLFNPTDNYDFVPNLTIDGITLESSDEMKLLGLTIRNDLSWKSNKYLQFDKKSIKETVGY